MKKLVLKYGGSSLSTIENIKLIAQNIKEYTTTYDGIIVVVSAMGNTTDKILEGTNRFATTNALETDKILSTGEAQSAVYLTLALNELGLKAKSFTGYECGIFTTDNYSNSFIKKINNNLYKYLKKNYICIITGFQGINKNKNITTIGRGGSDTTAVALAKKYRCECIIKKDVDGIFLFPPKIENNKLLNKINYDSMNELSASGAKVLAARSVALAKKYNIPIKISNCLKMNNGSEINEKRTDYESLQIDGITYEENINFLSIKSKNLADKNINNFLSNNLSNFQNFSTFINKNIKTFNFFIKDKDSKNFLANFKQSFDKEYSVIVSENLTKFSVVGNGFSSKSYFTNLLLEKIKQKDIEPEFLNINETNITFAISSNDKDKVFNILSKIIEVKK